jgi:hypothetical protein
MKFKTGSALWKATVSQSSPMNWNLTTAESWSRYNLYLVLGTTFVSGMLEIAVISDTMVFLYETFGVQQMGSSPMIVTYYIIFIFGLIFQVITQLEGTQNKNTIQVVAVGCFNVLAVVFMIFQIRMILAMRECSLNYASTAIRNGVLPLNATRSTPALRELQQIDDTCNFNTLADATGTKSLNAIATDIQRKFGMFDRTLGFSIFLLFFLIGVTIVGFYFSYKTYRQYGWSIYKRQGADISKRWMVNRYHLFMLFLKVNSYFFIGAASMYFASGYFQDKNGGLIAETDIDVVVFSIYGCFLIFVLVLNYATGFFAVRKCSSTLTAIFLATVGFYFYMVADLYLDSASIREVNNAIGWYYFFLSSQSVCLVLTTILTIFLVHDMKHGLKEVVHSIYLNEDVDVKRFSI